MSQQQQQKQGGDLPEQIKVFLITFHRNLRGTMGDSRCRRSLEDLYDHQFPKMCEQFYKIKPWPAAETIASIVKNDALAILLYKELTFRTLYSNSSIKVTAPMRAECFQNYVQLFEHIMETCDPENQSEMFDLPTAWLWDIVDEFIYQFQSNCQYRASKKGREEEKGTEIVWEAYQVIDILTRFVAQSQIIDIVHNAYNSRTVFEILRHGTGHAQRMIGYFALIGLLRLHVLQGDYYNALKVVEDIDLGNRRMGISTRVPACHVTACYYIGFSYLMLRRYVDAIKMFASVSSYISNNVLSNSRSSNKQTSQYDNIQKKYDQCLALLCICVVLNPRRIDSSLHADMRDKYTDQMAKLESGNLVTFEEMLRSAGPKSDAIKSQIGIFLEDVKIMQASDLPKIRSYIKLFSNISMEELAKEYLSDMSVDEIRTQLMCLKNKTRQLVHSDGVLQSAIAPPLLEGKWQNGGDVSFTIDDGKIHTTQGKQSHNLAKRFLKLLREV